MRAVLDSLKRNALALRRSKKETRRDHHTRLLLELRRRFNQLISRINPFDRDQYRLEQLAGPECAARVRFERDNAIEKIVLSWPASFATARADALGFVGDSGIADVIRAHLCSPAG